MKLKLRIWRTGSVVHMQVLEQENIVSKGNIQIRAYPQILKTGIRLRGWNKSRDDYIVNYCTLSEAKAELLIDQIVAWLNGVYTPQYDYGEYIQVKNSKDNDYKIRLHFISLIKSIGVICVKKGDEQAYYNHETFSTSEYTEIRDSIFFDRQTGIYSYSDKRT